MGSVKRVVLREYTVDDLTAIHAINEAEVPAVGAEAPDVLGHIASESVIALVATDDETGEIGGFCLVLEPGAAYHSGNYRWFSERYVDFIYLDRVAIRPAYQRRGLGRALYSEVERLAAERRPSADQFTLEVNLRPRNERSLAFHAELGFGEVGRRETEYGALVSLMAKPLW